MNVKRLLQQHARNAKIPYAQVLMHYAMERFLHRLSLSRYADKFFLKGGMLLTGMGATPARTTMDIDLLGRIDNSPDNIRKVVQDIIRVKAGADEVQMSDKVTVSEIMLNAMYHGVRVEIPASVAGERCSVSIDIGFSDEIVPGPCTLDYPSILEGMPPSRILCYSRESIVAEKWQSLVQLAGFTNRMKDYYDLWFSPTTTSLTSSRCAMPSLRPSPAGKRKSGNTPFSNPLITFSKCSLSGPHTSPSSNPPPFPASRPFPCPPKTWMTWLPSLWPGLSRP